MLIYGMVIMMGMRAVRHQLSVPLHVIQEVSILEKDMYVCWSVTMVMEHGLCQSLHGMVIISELLTAYRQMELMTAPADIIFRAISIILLSVVVLYPRLLQDGLGNQGLRAREWLAIHIITGLMHGGSIIIRCLTVSVMRGVDGSRQWTLTALTRTISDLY